MVAPPIPEILKRPQIKSWVMLLFKATSHVIRPYEDLWRFTKIWIRERIKIFCPKIVRVLEITKIEQKDPSGTLEITSIADFGPLLHMLHEEAWKRSEWHKFNLIRKRPDLLLSLPNIYVLPEEERKTDPSLVPPPHHKILNPQKSVGWIAINKGKHGPYLEQKAFDAKTLGILGCFLGIGFLMEGAYFTPAAIFHIPELNIFLDPKIPLMALHFGYSAPTVKSLGP